MASLAFACACDQSQDRHATPSGADSATSVVMLTGLGSIARNASTLPLYPIELRPVAPHPGWRLGMVSWIAVDRTGDVYLLQRGREADPIVVIDRGGQVLRSWGKGMFTMPHSIRIDPQGNIWTTDAATSMVYKFTPKGQKLMEIAVGGTPSPCVDQQIFPESERTTAANNFCGTTDVAFAPNGHVFVADGYANNRVLEYSADGRRLNEWGSAGTGPGQFRLPHSIEIDSAGIIYVADRENGRIQRFDLTGKYLGEWPHLGRVFSLKVSGSTIWLATQPLALSNLSPGWMFKLERATGRVLGYVPVTGGHGMEAVDGGDLMVGPGPNRASPQWFRTTRP